MKSRQCKWIGCLSMVLTCSGIAPPAGAVPVAGVFIEDSRGDVLTDQFLPQELGDEEFFPASSGLHYHDHRYGFTVGVPDDGVANDWTVHIENETGQAWKSLFFVADLGVSIGNADGRVQDLLGAPGVLRDAFRIDALGANANLLFESISTDGVFQPGEEWEFAVSNFNTGLNSLAPSLISPGVFAGSSPFGGIGGSNASILATPVPEPATAGLMGLLAGGLLLRRPIRRYVPYL